MSTLSFTADIFADNDSGGDEDFDDLHEAAAGGGSWEEEDCTAGTAGAASAASSSASPTTPTPAPSLKLHRSKSAEQGRVLLQRGLSSEGDAGHAGDAGDDDDDDDKTGSGRAAGGAAAATAAAATTAATTAAAAAATTTPTTTATDTAAASGHSQPRKGDRHGWAMGKAQNWRGGVLPAWARQLPVADVDKARRVVNSGGGIKELNDACLKSKLRSTSTSPAGVAGDEPMAKALIAAGADVNWTCPGYGRSPTSPLLSAIATGNSAIVAALLDAGADPNVANKDTGKTPLLQAVRSGHDHIVSLLIDAGAAPDAVDGTGSGWTALIMAAYTGRMEAAQALIAAGANVALASTRMWREHPAGSTARDIAERAVGYKRKVHAWGDAFWQQKQEKGGGEEEEEEEVDAEGKEDEGKA